MKPHTLQVDLATLRLHVEARAASYFAGPTNLTVGDACRYLAITEVRLCELYGYARVRGAVARIVAADPDVLELTEARRAQRAADRDARVTELDRLALVSYAAGDWATARRRVDEAELVDPTGPRDSYVASWAEVRDQIDQAERGLSRLPAAVAA